MEQYIKVKSSSESTNWALIWVHTAIRKLKKNLLGIYHMVSEKYLQNYLDEFAYKLNRRYFGEKLFNRLIIASVYPYVQHPNSHIFKFLKYQSNTHIQKIASQLTVGSLQSKVAINSKSLTG